MTIPPVSKLPVLEEIRYGIWSPSGGRVSANLYYTKSEALSDMESTISFTLDAARKLGGMIPAEMEKSIRDHYSVVEVYVKINLDAR